MEYKEGKEAHRLFLEMETPDLIKEVNRLIDKKGKLEEQVIALKVECKTLEEKRGECSMYISNATVDLDKIVSDTNLSRSENDSLIRENRGLQGQIEANKKTLDDTHTKVNEEEKKLKEIQEAYSFLESEYAILKSKIASLKLEKDDRDEDILKWEAKAKELQEIQANLSALKDETEQKIERNAMLIEMGIAHNKKIAHPLIP